MDTRWLLFAAISLHFLSSDAIAAAPDRNADEIAELVERVSRHGDCNAAAALRSVALERRGVGAEEWSDVAAVLGSRSEARELATKIVEREVSSGRVPVAGLALMSFLAQTDSDAMERLANAQRDHLQDAGASIKSLMTAAEMGVRWGAMKVVKQLRDDGIGNRSEQLAWARLAQDDAPAGTGMEQEVRSIISELLETMSPADIETSDRLLIGLRETRRVRTQNRIEVSVALGAECALGVRQ